MTILDFCHKLQNCALKKTVSEFIGTVKINWETPKIDRACTKRNIPLFDRNRYVLNS